MGKRGAAKSAREVSSHLSTNLSRFEHFRENFTLALTLAFTVAVIVIVDPLREIRSRNIITVGCCCLSIYLYPHR